MMSVDGWMGDDGAKMANSGIELAGSSCLTVVIWPMCLLDGEGSVLLVDNKNIIY